MLQLEPEGRSPEGISSTARDNAAVYAHHIRFLREDGIVETLQGHPFVGQLRIGSVILFEVAASINVLSQTKVSHPDTPSRVQPIGMYPLCIRQSCI